MGAGEQGCERWYERGKFGRGECGVDSGVAVWEWAVSSAALPLGSAANAVAQSTQADGAALQVSPRSAALCPKQSECCEQPGRCEAHAFAKRNAADSRRSAQHSLSRSASSARFCWARRSRPAGKECRRGACVCTFTVWHTQSLLLVARLSATRARPTGLLALPVA